MQAASARRSIVGLQEQSPLEAGWVEAGQRTLSKTPRVGLWFSFVNAVFPEGGEKGADHRYPLLMSWAVSPTAASALACTSVSYALCSHGGGISRIQ